jgi:hypothetical protein
MLIELRDTLSDLFPDEQSARRVVDDASINPEYIDFSGSAATFWSQIIRHAHRNDALLRLVSVALRQYPSHKSLLRMQGGLEYGRPKMNGYADAEDEATGAHSDLRTVVHKLDRRAEGFFYGLIGLTALQVVVLLLVLVLLMELLARP